MAGYIGTKAVLLSTTAASVTGNADIGGTVTADGLTVDGGNLSKIQASSNGRDLIFQSQEQAGVGQSSKIGTTSNHEVRFISNNTERLRIANNGDISFYEDTGTTPKFFWDASAERLGLGTTSPAQVIHAIGGSYTGLRLETSDALGASYIDFGDNSDPDVGGIQYFHTDNSMRFVSNAAERLRVDASGNLLVNKTGLGGDVSGFIFNPSTLSSGANAYMFATNTRTDGTGYLVGLNRQGSDGDIIEFRKANAKVGSIGTGYASCLFIGDQTSGLTSTHILFCNGSVRPATSSGAQNDNALDMGDAAARWDDIYATNGTIQTSDRNEKQDIAELDEAERRVAVAAKGLLRKFRWKDAVAEKGDDARIHFGIIAQDLQAAFEAEGLDAGRYAMFISSTWWEADRVIPAVEAQDAVYEAQLDEDGNEVQVLVSEAVEAQPEQVVTDTYETQAEAPEGAVERTRLGVRYPELLAFIIGAM